MVEENLKKIYKLNPNVYPWKNRKYIDRKIGSSHYGEISQRGTEILMDKFSDYFNKDMVFYDIGSGLGKMVLHVGLTVNPRKSTGIEYSPPRHKGAIHLKNQYAPSTDNIEFFNMAFQECDISDATVIHCDNTLFPVKVCKEVYDKVPKNCLYLFKRLGYNPDEITETIHQENGILRTYLQDFIYWLIKE